MVRLNESESGAALITALLMVTLLLAVGGTLLLMTSTVATNAINSTAEMQSYYSAEAGLQATLNVLRGNVQPWDAGLQSSNTKMSFRNAVTPSTSNYSGDSVSNSGIARLSGWLHYDTTYTDRVLVSSSYTPMNGMAYSVVITDPDNTPSGTEPNRVLVQVVGYGPKNAIKTMQMMVAKPFLNNFLAPATVTLIGSTSNTANISFGNSNAYSLSGVDQAHPTAPPYPSVGVTTANDLAAANNADSRNKLSPPPQLLSGSSIPYFLQTADAARATLSDLQQVAQSINRYYTNSSPPPDVGSPSQPKLTFVDGDLTLSNSSGTGAGLLVVTGTLTLNGNYSFQGLILVLGTGKVIRNGGGNGSLDGAIFVSSFDRTQAGAPFLAPTFDTSGGGNSSIDYNSDYINNGLELTARRVLGVVER